MRISITSANDFRFCPAYFAEKNIFGLEVDSLKREKVSGLDFGKRFHQLLCEHYLGAKAPDPWLPEDGELEAQVMLARYKATYPTEEFDVIETETKHVLPIGPRVPCPCGVWEVESGINLVKKFDKSCGDCRGTGERSKHELSFIQDMVVRDKLSGRLKVFETKTESRNSRTNLPLAWSAKDQGSIYIYGGQQIFGEAFDGVILNVCTRQSPAGREPASFRRDNIQRTQEQVNKAIEDIIETADMIEAMEARHPDPLTFPQWREQCVNRMGWACDFFKLHVIGRSEEHLAEFKRRT